MLHEKTSFLLVNPCYHDFYAGARREWKKIAGKRQESGRGRRSIFRREETQAEVRSV
jgi:hypothetical protein